MLNENYTRKKWPNFFNNYGIRKTKSYIKDQWDILSKYNKLTSFIPDLNKYTIKSIRQLNKYEDWIFNDIDNYMRFITLNSTFVYA